MGCSNWNQTIFAILGFFVSDFLDFFLSYTRFLSKKIFDCFKIIKKEVKQL
jgi:hypothetical protein